MKIRVKRIAPLQAGKMLAVIYALFSVIAIPFLLLGALAGTRGGGGPALTMAIVFPLLYIVGGFIGGIIGAFIYNIVAGWIGGMEMEFEEEET